LNRAVYPPLDREIALQGTITRARTSEADEATTDNTGEFVLEVVHHDQPQSRKVGLQSSGILSNLR
jgi:hypothetical protein